MPIEMVNLAHHSDTKSDEHMKRSLWLNDLPATNEIG